MSVIANFWHDDSGQGLTEYALVLALVSIGLIAVLVIFRDAIGGIFDRMDNLLIAAPVLYYYFRFFLSGTVA